MNRHGIGKRRGWRRIAGIAATAAVFCGIVGTVTYGVVAGQDQRQPVVAQQCEVAVAGHHYTLHDGSELAAPGAELACSHGTVTVTVTRAPQLPRVACATVPASVLHAHHLWHVLHMLHLLHVTPHPSHT